MISKAMTELGLLRSREPHPTLEVDADSLEEAEADLDDIALGALRRLAKEQPGLTSTIFLFGSQSVNFHKSSWSEFLIPVGTERTVNAVLNTLHSAFKRHAGVESRMSDYVQPTQGVARFHIEAGLVWLVEDAVTWCRPDDEKPEPTPETDTQWDDAANADEVPDVQTEFDSPTVRRPRRARSDASIGTIRRDIERAYGLPEGSVMLCQPGGKALRSDALIRTLRSRWE